MRSAKIEDNWRSLYKKSYDLMLSKIKFENLKGFKAGEVIFTGGLTAICGGNGVGKSTLLNAISSILSSDRLVSQKSINFKLEGANLSGEFIDTKISFNRTVSIKFGEFETDLKPMERESVWIDGSVHGPSMIEVFSNMPNLNELLESEAPRIASQEERKLISYIIGKEYSYCEIYELDLEKYGVIPYFKVKSNGIEYGSESMGSGEISVHFILWHLQRIKKNSLVLMEEPETFLAPKSQEALINGVAKIALERGLWVILTTHSPNIIKNIPLNHVRILVRDGKDVEVFIPNDESEFLRSLGLKHQKIGAIYVEDRCAREYAKCWLGKFDPSILQNFEIIDIGSKDNIINQLKMFPKIKGLFKIFGLFDGDQKSEIKELFKWNYSFLPSELAPEIFLKEIALSNREELATLCGRELREINLALQGLEGIDHHDWIIDFPKNLGITYEQMILHLFNLSISDQELFANSAGAFELFSAELSKALQ